MMRLMLRTCLVVLALATSCKKKEAPAGPCAPQQFTKSGMACCAREPSYYWNGYRCVDGSNELGRCGCTCEGPDCGKQFLHREECTMAFARCPVR